MEELYSLSPIVENFILALFFGGVVAVLSWIAWFHGLYTIPYPQSKHPKITFSQLFITFLILIFVYRLLPPLYYLFFVWTGLSNPQLLDSYTQILLYLTLILSLYFYNLFQDHTTMKRVWKDHYFPENRPLFQDINLALLTFLIALPTSLAVNHLFDALNLFFFPIDNQDQLAVEYLKKSLSDRFASAVALSFILIIAPIVEEYIFRGVLQSWLRRYLSPVLAILLCSFLFAFFHYDPRQGINNLPILTSLFALALYLGFLYEKTRSLFASITLHMTFNLVNVICIIIALE